jgi:hypothetical protein
MPIAGVCGCEGPDYIFEGQSGLYLRVFCNILIVIQADELSISHWPKDSQSGYDETQTDQEF